MRRLIVNADDFGLTDGVNRAIAELHQEGRLTSATLMARAAATQEALRIAFDTPTLGTGCHVVLVDGEPVLTPQQIPTLVDRKTGKFYPTLGTFLRRVLAGSIDHSEIEAEATAQIAVIRKRGIRLTHVDTHKHTHMFPSVLRPLLRAASGAGVTAVRNPFEPVWSRRATHNASMLRRTEVSLLHRLEPAFRRIVDAAGVSTTDGSIGVLATGSLDRVTVRSLFKNMPGGTWEMVTHPGYKDYALAQVRTRLRESRETERSALMEIGEQSGVELISFADLCSDGHARAVNSSLI